MLSEFQKETCLLKEGKYEYQDAYCIKIPVSDYGLQLPKLNDLKWGYPSPIWG